jgi:hypothetical protein
MLNMLGGKKSSVFKTQNVFGARSSVRRSNMRDIKKKQDNRN